MDWIIESVYSSTQWLYKVIYSNKFFFIDFWTFNHIWSGAFIYLLLRAKRIKRTWLVLILLLFTYEIIEILFRIFALNLFKPEIIKDQINDIIFGLTGAVLCHYLIRLRKDRTFNRFHLRYPLTSFLTAGTVSYLFVGFSGFGIDQTNEKAFIFIFLWIALYYLLQTYESFKNKKQGELKASLLASIIFFSILILIILLHNSIFLSFSANSVTIFHNIFFNQIKIKETAVFLMLPTISIILYKAFKKLIWKVTN